MSKFIRKIIEKIVTKYHQATMKTQLTIMYFAAVFVPILIVSIILVTINVQRLDSYQQDLVDSNNRNVRSMIYEITSQIYNISSEITYDDTVVSSLSDVFVSEEAYQNDVEKVTNAVNDITASYSILESVNIFLDSEYAGEDGMVQAAESVAYSEEWYQKAISQYSVFWSAWLKQDDYGNRYWYLALVRQIPLHGTDTKAVMVITIDNNYLQNRIETQDYYTLLTMEDDTVIYSTNRSDCGINNLINTASDDNYYSYRGGISYYDFTYKGTISTLNMVQSDSYIHIVTISTTAGSSINQVVWIMIIIILLALALPALIMTIFTRSLTKQVTSLRNEMYKASQGDFNMEGFDGCFELNQTYADLLTMIDHVQERDARMYQNEIAEQHLLNEQQKMEFKMLASQINPHFLYNTLEMIRMKALAAGDKETATAIKLLGKSMRYVLDNTGTEYTTLTKELSHIETYLQIQRLRFGDRVNYFLNVEDEINTDEVQILPLLLQPIVENAVLHGLEEVETGGRIEVNICKESFNSMRIEIHDNGCGMDEKTLEDMRKNLKVGHINKRYGIGLYNINRRLRMNYGETYGLTIDSKPGEGTTVTAKLKMNPHI